MLKTGFWSRNCENISPDSESPPPRYRVCQYSVKMVNSDFFGQYLGKLPNYVRYVGSNNAEGVAERWIEAEMSWVEVVGGGWSWVEVGTRFSYTHFSQAADL